MSRAFIKYSLHVHVAILLRIIANLEAQSLLYKDVVRKQVSSIDYMQLASYVPLSPGAPGSPFCPIIMIKYNHQGCMAT